MKEVIRKIILNIIGILFILIGLFSSGYAIYINETQLIFWFCYIGVILLGIGILMRNSDLILSQLDILTIPLLLWIIDFVFSLILKKSPLGITSYFFEPQSNISKFISLQHLYTLPLAFFSLYLIKIKRLDAWKITLIEVISLFFITRLFVTQNINCVYESCMSIGIKNPILYVVAWFVFAIVMIYITNFIILKIKIFK